MMDPISTLFAHSEPESDSLPDAANDRERRLHNRNVKVMRVARLKDVKLHAECLGLVRDVSPGGMMIDADFPLEIGQSVSIALLDDQELTGDVVWLDGKTVGIEFAHPVDVEYILAKPSIKPDGRRARLPRFKVKKPVTLRIDEKSADAMLLDISQRGAKFQCDFKLKLHSNILVRLNRESAVRATVKWRAGNLVGVEFHRLFSVDELGIWLKG
jgi:PilZ domain